MITIYVARHGETTWNAEGKIQGRSDPELSPKGVAQSLALCERLKDRPISAIYTSTLRRSFSTARPLAEQLNLPIQKVPELDEIAFGILEGRSLWDGDGLVRAEIDRYKVDRLRYRIPGGETYLDVSNRVRPFVEILLQRHDGQEVLVVGHRGVNRMLLGWLLELCPERAVRIEQTNDCIYIVRRNGEPKAFYNIDGASGEGLFYVEPLESHGP